MCCLTPGQHPRPTPDTCYACDAMQVTGTGLQPFTVDKQTLFLQGLTTAYQSINAPFVCLNVSSAAPVPAGGNRRQAVPDAPGFM